ncbi:MAG: diaminopimelate decarboxylase [Candidatus Acetothermia bacterium]|jgi:diaminopimelate decarboxylase|nr:diaminopimelate decarboxylase [Candidatus Acetothermia bacterium]
MGPSWLEVVGGVLWTEGIPLTEVANWFGTPCYLYSTRGILENLSRLRTALAGLPVELCYAVKANPNGAVLRLLSREGLGAEVVSGGELTRALRARFPPGKILFSGVGKTEEELRGAVHEGLRAIVVESLEELDLLARLAMCLNRKANVALRVHPSLDPHTHPYLATGQEGSKFGLDIVSIATALDKLVTVRELTLVGFHVHLGSQVREVNPYMQALDQLMSPVKAARERGFFPTFLDLGGGFAIPYEDGETAFPVSELGGALRGHSFDDLTLLFEPGRALVGSAGILLTKVLYRKRVHGRAFVVVDAGMSDLIRPSLYGTHHRIVPVRTRHEGTQTVTVVGPLCENADVLARECPLPPVAPGDVLAVLDVGAYGFAMASQYNSRPRAAEVLVVEGEVHLVRSRETPADLWRGEEVPECLA